MVAKIRETYKKVRKEAGEQYVKWPEKNKDYTMDSMLKFFDDFMIKELSNLISDDRGEVIASGVLKEYSWWNFKDKKKSRFIFDFKDGTSLTIYRKFRGKPVQLTLKLQ